MIYIHSYKDTINYVKQFYIVNRPSHDIFHALAVFGNVEKICKTEGIKSDIAKMAALFHDIYQIKDGQNKDVEKSASCAKDYLINVGHKALSPQAVYNVIIEADWENFQRGIKASSLDTHILRDADWLESIGAHGIARAFSYSGEKGIPFGFKPYDSDDFSVLNHINEKLLKMKDCFHFESAKQEALKRHEFIVQFTKSLNDELTW